MNVDEVKAIIRAMSEVPVSGLDYEEVGALLPGIFYQSQSPDEPPFAAAVEEGQTLGLIEAMKMLAQVKAPRSGVLVGVHAENGASVEADAILFEIE